MLGIIDNFFGSQEVVANTRLTRLFRLDMITAS